MMKPVLHGPRQSRSFLQTVSTVAATLGFGSLLLLFSGGGGAQEGAAPQPLVPGSTPEEACPLAEVPAPPACPKSAPDDASPGMNTRAGSEPA